MFHSVLFPLTLALSATTPLQQGQNEVEARISSEISRLENSLDPASVEALHSTQATWERWVQSFDQRVADALKNDPSAAEELAQIRIEAREQRVDFLLAIQHTPAEQIPGGWSDGVTTVLFQNSARGRAKLVSMVRDKDQKLLLCAVEGTAQPTVDGFIIAPDKPAATPVKIRRLGVALSVEDGHSTADGVSPYCPSGGRLSGEYFRIEGAEKVMPWLLNSPFD